MVNTYISIGRLIHRPLGAYILRTDTNNMQKAAQNNCVRQRKFLSKQVPHTGNITRVQRREDHCSSKYKIKPN